MLDLRFQVLLRRRRLLWAERVGAGRAAEVERLWHVEVGEAVASGFQDLSRL